MRVLFDDVGWLTSAVWVVCVGLGGAHCKSHRTAEIESRVAERSPGPDPVVGASSESCGNGIIDAEEVCDQGALAGASCEDFGFPRGELSCSPSCAGYVVAHCRGLPDWPEEVGTYPFEPSPCTGCGPEQFCEQGKCVSVRCSDRSNGSPVGGAYDLGTLRVQGAVQLPSGVTPSSSSRAHVRFLPEGASVTTDAMVELSEQAEFDLNLVPGSFRVEVWISDVPGLPSGPLEFGTFDFENDRRVELDVSTPAEMRGTLHLDSNRDDVDADFIFDPQTPGTTGEVKIEGSDWPRRYRYLGYERNRVDVYLSWSGNDRKTEIANDIVLKDEMTRDFTGTLRIHSLETRVRVDGGPVERAHHLELAICREPNEQFRDCEALYQHDPEPSADDDRVRSELADGRVQTDLQSGSHHVVARLKPNYDDHVYVRSRDHEPLRRSRLVNMSDDREISFDLSLREEWATIEVTADSSDDFPTDTFGAYWVGVRAADGTWVVRTRSDSSPPGQRTEQGIEFFVRPGRYDLLFNRSDRDSFGQSRKLADDFRVEAGENYRFDIGGPMLGEREAVEVRGRITLNGAWREPECWSKGSGDFGLLEFERIGEPSLSAGDRLNRSTYRVRVPPGRYRVYVIRSEQTSACEYRSNVPVGRGVYVLDPELRVSGSTRRDFDMNLSQVRGSLSVDGAAPTLPPERMRDNTHVKGQSGEVTVLPHWKSRSRSRWDEFSPALEVPIVNSSHSAEFEYLAFPGFYRLHYDLPASGGSFFSRAIRAAGGGIRVDQQVPRTRVEGEILFAGEPVNGQKSPRMQIRAKTRVGEWRGSLEEDGSFTFEVIGEDPRLTFLRAEQPRSVLGPPTRACCGRRPCGIHVLRKGCGGM